MRSTPKQAAAITLLCGVLILLLLPMGADYPAHYFRLWLFKTEGFTTYNHQWYGGHNTPSYSLLYPPLAAAIGLKLSGLLAAVSCSYLFARILTERFGTTARWGSYWFAVGICTNLVVGRMPFIAGAAFALAAFAYRDRRAWLKLPLAGISSLMSPLAGLFLALALTAEALTFAREKVDKRTSVRKTGDRLLIVLIALLPIAITSSIFPEGGTQPFPLSTLIPALVVTASALLLLPTDNRSLRIGSAGYLLLLTFLFVVATPIGSNIVRLGMMISGPVLLTAVLSRRSNDVQTVGIKPWRNTVPLQAALTAISLFAVWWQVGPAAQAVARSHKDPATKASFYQPLLTQLQRLGAKKETTVEIPFTLNHWESYFVARKVRLARGWERQLDLKHNSLFYKGTLNNKSYLAWLRQKNVRYVAVANTQLDYSARDESKLISYRPSYLKLRWKSQNWLLFEVID